MSFYAIHSFLLGGVVRRAIARQLDTATPVRDMASRYGAHLQTVLPHPWRP